MFILSWHDHVQAVLQISVCAFRAHIHARELAGRPLKALILRRWITTGRLWEFCTGLLRQDKVALHGVRARSALVVRTRDAREPTRVSIPGKPYACRLFVSWLAASLLMY